jgi:hypothetical protein
MCAFDSFCILNTVRVLISLWLCEENNKLRHEKMYLHIPPLSSTHTYDFVVVTSLTHQRKILFVVLQMGK